MVVIFDTILKQCIKQVRPYYTSSVGQVAPPKGRGRMFDA